jgi:hypothetical protein
VPEIDHLGKKTNSGVFLFGIVSFAWLFFGSLIILVLNNNYEKIVLNYRTFFGFWVLSIMDLVVLAKFLSTVAHYLNAKELTRAALGVQALIWGLFKILCLGLFVLVLLKGQEIPLHGLLLGMGTLVVVPLAGGFFWSQRILKNA